MQENEDCRKIRTRKTSNTDTQYEKLAKNPQMTFSDAQIIRFHVKTASKPFRKMLCMIDI